MRRQSVLLEYILKNKKSFVIIISLFLFGMISGIIFINNASDNQIQEIKEYVTKLINNIKSFENVNKTELLAQSLKKNILNILLIWFLGCTIIGSIFIFFSIIS